MKNLMMIALLLSAPALACHKPPKQFYSAPEQSKVQPQWTHPQKSAPHTPHNPTAEKRDASQALP